MLVDRVQANRSAGKVPKPIPASLPDTLARKPGKALSGMASRHRSSFSFTKTANYTDAQSTKTSKGGALLSSKVRTLYLTMEVEAMTHALRSIVSWGDRPQMPPSSQSQWPCYKKQWRTWCHILLLCLTRRPCSWRHKHWMADAKVAALANNVFVTFAIKHRFFTYCIIFQKLLLSVFSLPTPLQSIPIDGVSDAACLFPWDPLKPLFFVDYFPGNREGTSVSSGFSAKRAVNRSGTIHRVTRTK